jgi:hypothetical protein
LQYMGVLSSATLNLARVEDGSLSGGMPINVTRDVTGSFDSCLVPVPTPRVDGGETIERDVVWAAHP